MGLRTTGPAHLAMGPSLACPCTCREHSQGPPGPGTCYRGFLSKEVSLTPRQTLSQPGSCSAALGKSHSVTPTWEEAHCEWPRCWTVRKLLHMKRCRGAVVSSPSNDSLRWPGPCPCLQVLLAPSPSPAQPCLAPGWSLSLGL